MQDSLHAALEQISSEKQYQEKCLLMLVQTLEMCRESKAIEHTYSNAERNYLLSKYQLVVSSVLMASLPRHFPDSTEVQKYEASVRRENGAFESLIRQKSLMMIPVGQGVLLGGREIVVKRLFFNNKHGATNFYSVKETFVLR